MATVYENDTVHIKDSWNQQVPPVTGLSVAIGDEVHIKEDFSTSLAGGVVDLEKVFIFDEVDLKESHSKTLIDSSGSLNVALNDEVDLKEKAVENIYTDPGVVVHENDSVDLMEELIFAGVTTHIGNFKKNQNITFGDTESPNYKEYSHRFRWTNYNGIAVPDLNYKDLKEPIVRMMPAPSFLQFEYANSFLLFTRNTINRFVLKADVETGQWRAQTDNLIEEFKDLGLMEAKTLILAGDTLFGLSEKGVWKWNKEGMELISDKIIDLPDAGIYEYIAFYNSIRNQYILHRQEEGGKLYQLMHGSAVALPAGVGALNIGAGYVYMLMLTDTTYIHLAWYDSNSAFFVIGTVDTANQSVSWGATVVASGRENNIHSICKMSDTRLVYTFNTIGSPRKIIPVKISGTVVTYGTVQDIGGNDIGGWLVSFSATRFVCFNSENDYRCGTYDGEDTITLDDPQYIWSADVKRLRGITLSDGKAIIVYGLTGGGNIRARIIEDAGDGTVTFGPVLDTGIPFVSTDSFDIVLTGGVIFVVASSNTDLILAPLTITDTTVAVGSLTTKAGYCDTPGGISMVAIANRGTSGFWIFYEDALNSGYLTTMWGTGSDVKMSLWEDTKEVINANESRSVGAVVVPGGFAVLEYVDGTIVTDDGYAQVWGFKTNAIDSFVYQIDRDKWGKFRGIDILDVPVILSGGSLDENYNLWLDSDRELKKYPGTAYTAVEAYIRTKEFYIEKGAFQRWLIDFEGSGVNVETRVRRMVGGSKVDKEDIKYNVTSNKFRGISLDKQRGYEMSIKIIDADIIKGLSYDSKKWGED